MKYEIVKELDKGEFRRLTGVKRSTFNKMVGILCEENKKKKAKGGRKNKLNEENMLLMVLEYLREYRTYFHISQSYGVSESTAYAGYRGFQKIHKNVELPHRRMKKSPLIKEKKVENRELASKRVVVENVIGLLKRFKIIADRYRNRRKRFGLRFNLIAGIHNFELSI